MPYSHFSRSILIAILMFSFVWIVSVHAQSSQSMSARSEYGKKSVAGYFIQSPLTLDGSLNEPAWNDAQTASDFFQQEPLEGTPATEKTEVKFLYNKNNLYVGVMCYDNEPEKIVHNEMRVDGDLRNDDNFSMVFDTFNDKRNGFYFCVNPNGARQDAKLGSSMRGVSSGRINDDWNGIWDVSAKITDCGWSAEIVIPFKTLRFTNEEIQNWGINFKRDIARKNEEVLWTSWGRDDGLMQLTKAGTLSDLKNIERGQKLEFKPYTLAGREKNMGIPDNNIKYGFDLKYPLTSDLTLDFTTFTDFAQIEADRTIINLTRFGLRYPEKREFFLEGAEIFEFSSRYTSPFYSRNIGITPGREQVPILAGGKITGKAGSYNLGILNMHTDNKNGYPTTNYSVFRIKKDILEKSSVGMIATNIYNADKYKEQSFGLDFTYKTNTFLKNKNLEITADLTENIKPGVNHGTRAGRVSVRYPNDLINIFLYHKIVGDNYSPELGFVQRQGVKQYMARFEYSPRPAIPYVKQLRFNPLVLSVYTDMSGKLESRTMGFSPFGITMETEDNFSINVHNSYECLDYDFNIFNNVIIPEGVYEWWNYETSLRTNPSRPVSFDFVYQWGNYYNGDKTSFGTEADFKMNRYFSISADIEYNDLTIGSRSFDTREYCLHLNTNVSPRLSARTYIQWNNEDKIANLNFRIHFIPQIGSDIYFVYNHMLDGYKDYKTIYNTGISKIAYLITF